LKARVPLEDLEKLRQALLSEVARRGQASDSTDTKPTSTGEEESP